MHIFIGGPIDQLLYMLLGLLWKYTEHERKHKRKRKHKQFDTITSTSKIIRTIQTV